MDFQLDHAHFVCRDVRAMAGYFERVFGAEILRFQEDLKGAPNAMLRLGSMNLFVRGVRPGEKPDARAPGLVEGLDHLGFQVEDVAAAAAWLRGRGAEFAVEPQRTGIGGRMIAFLRGPENIRIELCERPRGG